MGNLGSAFGVFMLFNPFCLAIDDVRFKSNFYVIVDGAA